MTRATHPAARLVSSRRGCRGSARRNSRFRSSKQQEIRRRAARRSQGRRCTPFGCPASSLAPKSFSGCPIRGSAFDTTLGAAPDRTSMGRCWQSGGYPGWSACTAAWTRFWTCGHWLPLDLRRFAGQARVGSRQYGGQVPKRSEAIALFRRLSSTRPISSLSSSERLRECASHRTPCPRRPSACGQTGVPGQRRRGAWCSPVSGS